MVKLVSSMVSTNYFFVLFISRRYIEYKILGSPSSSNGKEDK